MLPSQDRLLIRVAQAADRMKPTADQRDGGSAGLVAWPEASRFARTPEGADPAPSVSALCAGPNALPTSGTRGTGQPCETTALPVPPARRKARQFETNGMSTLRTGGMPWRLGTMALSAPRGRGQSRKCETNGMSVLRMGGMPWRLGTTALAALPTRRKARQCETNGMPVPRSGEQPRRPRTKGTQRQRTGRDAPRCGMSATPLPGGPPDRSQRVQFPPCSQIL
jgi:hypothetical protein